jgi:hypothetical protein
MNYKEVQGTAYQCLGCKQTYFNTTLAENCCKQYHCKHCGKNTPKYILACDACSEKSRFEKAEKMTEAEYFQKYPNNMIYCEDRFYSDSDDLRDCLDDEVIPDYVWGTDEFRIELNAGEIATSLEENSDLEDWTIEDQGVKELAEFLEKWNKDYGTTAYFRNNVAILIEESEAE